MLKKQSTYRFFVNYLSTPNHQRPCHHFRALIMAYMTRNDSFFKGFHNLPQPSMSSSSLVPFYKIDNVSIDNISSVSFGFRIKRGGGVGLTLRGCSDSYKPGNESRPCAFTAPHHQLVRDLEIGLEDSSKSSSCNSGLYVNGHRTSQGGKLLGFPDYPLTGKIAVAVDVDEGILQILAILWLPINCYIAFWR